MINLLTAEEARMKIRSTQKDRFENEMLIIAKIINESVEAGQMHCIIDASISQDAKDELLSRGYIINTDIWGTTIIRWEYE